MKVPGIGGFFFLANNPSDLATWYDRVFGVTKVPGDYRLPGWRQKEGMTVFAPFARDTGYFGRSSQAWMINVRAENLEEAVSDLKKRGISVEVDPETYPNGRFARLADPEGNPIQLWQPHVIDA